LPRLLGYCLKMQLGGLEFLVGIPGTVGGALVMNAGTRDGSIADALLWVDVLDENNRRRHISRSDLTPGYRSMGLPENWVILGGGFGVDAWVNGSLRGRLSKLMRHRKSTQPPAAPSAGCVFKNPEGHAAGALIEKAGLKGFRIGDAEVSNRHANWIINRGRARAQDVMTLIEHIEDRVERASGIRLEREIRIIGL
jgi:UDP-N-acetylmuramate dehydrogenase